MMRVPLTIGLLTASCFVFGFPAGSPASDHDGLLGGGAGGASADRRPVLEVRQGRYFRASVPRGWSFHETTNGVDVAAPDGATGASASILVGGFAAQMSPERYLQMVLQSLGHPPQSIVHWEPLPSRPAFLSFSWQLGRAKMRFSDQGTPVEAEAIAGVVQGAGQYIAVIMSAQAPVGSFSSSRAWLLHVAESITVTNPREVAMLDQLVLPRNIPHDEIYGSYNEGWHNRGIPEVRLSQHRREGTMGYEVMESPTSGKRFDMPLGQWDPTIQGYRNPYKPEEILVRPREYR